MSDYALFVNSLFLCLSCSELVVGKLQFKARKQAYRPWVWIVSDMYKNTLCCICTAAVIPYRRIYNCAMVLRA